MVLWVTGYEFRVIRLISYLRMAIPGSPIPFYKGTSFQGIATALLQLPATSNKLSAAVVYTLNLDAGVWLP